MEDGPPLRIGGKAALINEGQVENSLECSNNGSLDYFKLDRKAKNSIIITEQMKVKKSIPSSTSTPVLHSPKLSLNTVRKNGRFEDQDIETFRPLKIHTKDIKANDKKSNKASEKVSLHVAQSAEMTANANSHFYIGNQIEIKSQAKPSKAKAKDEGKKRAK